MILVLDNYYSFTYNLVHYIGECGEEVLVVRNDEISVDEIDHLNPKKIVVSPGPCTPAEAGISIELIKSSSVPVLGVCFVLHSISPSSTPLRALRLFPMYLVLSCHWLVCVYPYRVSLVKPRPYLHFSTAPPPLLGLEWHRHSVFLWYFMFVVV